MWECAFLFSLTIVLMQGKRLIGGKRLLKKSLQDFVGRRVVSGHTERDVGKNPVLCWQSQHAEFSFSLCSYGSLGTPKLSKIYALIDLMVCLDCTFFTLFRRASLCKSLAMKQNEKRAFFSFKMKPNAKCTKKAFYEAAFCEKSRQNPRRVRSDKADRIRADAVAIVPERTGIRPLWQRLFPRLGLELAEEVSLVTALAVHGFVLQHQALQLLPSAVL